MAEPTKKSPGIAEVLEAFAGRTTAIQNNVCVRRPIGCGGPAHDFRDPESKHEYSISGLCQKCQDEVFGR